MGRYARTTQYTPQENVFWERFVNSAGRIFLTQTGLEFRYEIRGNEVLVNRKSKSITRASVMQGYRRMRELLIRGVEINGPRMLGVFGASYLLPVFRELHVEEETAFRDLGEKHFVQGVLF